MEEQGYRVLEKNYRCPGGEIDLIARDGDYLVFAEVKYRSSQARGWPEEAVNPEKQQRIRRAARFYLYRNHYGEDTPCRFDVVGILGERVRLIRNAF